MHGFLFVKKYYCHLFPLIGSPSRFNRTRRALLQTTDLLRQKMASAFPISFSRYFVIDSFPLAVCKFGRARYCSAFRSYGADYEKYPSKKETYFDYKVHALITLEAYITDITNDADVADDVRVFRKNGSEKRYYNNVVGRNSRQDELQAGLLRVRLSHMKEVEEDKRNISKRYLTELKNVNIELSKNKEKSTHILDQFVIKTDHRQNLIDYLNDKEIGTIIHYPIPPHLSEAYHYLNLSPGCMPITEKYSETVLSLPLYNGISKQE